MYRKVLHITFFTVSLLFLTDEASSQSYANSDSIISVKADVRIDELVARFNRSHEIHGYRIQIVSASKKEAAKKVLSRFAGLYQNIQAHEVYQQPFFIVKVGDFFTKLEAEKFHREIEEGFPGSFIIPDVIEPYKQYCREETK